MTQGVNRKMSRTDLSFWQAAWKQFSFHPGRLTAPSTFDPFLTKYLARVNEGQTRDLLDIGCFPGRFLHFFAKNLGYRVFGIDFLPETAHVQRWLKESGVEAKVTVADFFHFTPGRGYDVVTSFGFVEHFPNWQEVLDRHIALLNPGGTLIIGMPNYRYGQYWLHFLLNPSFMEGHFIEVMDPKKWAAAAEARGLEVLYAGYHGTFGIWSRLPGQGWLHLARKILLRLLDYVARAIDCLKFDYPNRFFSSYIFIVARHPGLKWSAQTLG